MYISKRAQNIEPSVTLAISSKAKQLKSEGIDVIGFGAGEPDFDTPENIKSAAVNAIKNGETKYTPASGTVELKKAIIKKFKRDNGLDYAMNQISVNCGAKHSIFNLIMVLCNKGDEVIIPAPYWVSYPEQVKFAGGEPVVLNTSEKDSFKITADSLRSVVTDKTKALILNSPSNPTGMLYSEQELKAIAEVAVEKDFIVISDEIYEELVYDGNKHISIATLGDEINKRTVVVNGVSKAYAMTGWRIGYVAGDAEIIKAVNGLQSHSTSNPTSISQKASVEALNGPQGAVAEMLKSFDERRKYMTEALNSIEGISCLTPQGAFYCFPNISALYGKSYEGKVISGSLDFADLLLDEAKVAIVPGIGFGEDNGMRMSYATSMDNIKNGIERIKEFVSKLK